MSVVGVFFRSSISLLSVLGVSLLIVSGVCAETPKSLSAGKKVLRQPAQAITKGWEPVREMKPITRGWKAVAKSAVILRKLNKLTDKDYAAALQAVHYALSEIEDGEIYHWKRDKNKLHGKVMPINAFKDKEGRVCRHLIYTLALGKYRKTVEGIACRSVNGNWSLSG